MLPQLSSKTSRICNRPSGDIRGPEVTIFGDNQVAESESWNAGLSFLASVKNVSVYSLSIEP
jgi:hypothetical protein